MTGVAVGGKLGLNVFVERFKKEDIHNRVTVPEVNGHLSRVLLCLCPTDFQGPEVTSIKRVTDLFSDPHPSSLLPTILVETSSDPEGSSPTDTTGPVTGDRPRGFGRPPEPRTGP